MQFFLDQPNHVQGKSLNSMTGRSDLPLTHNDTFSGMTATPFIVSAFTNTTGKNHTITLKNTFLNGARTAQLDLSSYQVPGYTLNKVDVNVTKNQAIAQKDWVLLLKTSGSIANSYAITNPTDSTSGASSTGIPCELLAQNITGNWRYQVLNISVYVAITTLNGLSANDPYIQLWDNTTSGSTDYPNQSYWSASLPRTTSGSRIWVSTASSYVINASKPSQRSWFIVINGTQWGNGLPGNDYIYWSYVTNSGGGGRFYNWPPAPGWGIAIQNRRFTSAYQRLYLADGGSQNRTFSPSQVHLSVNGTTFDTNGRASITNSPGISMLNFTSNVTCVSANLTLKLYYQKTNPAFQRFYNDKSASINWNITSTSAVTFPAGTFIDKYINVTVYPGWSINGTYTASSIALLSSATNHTQYTRIGNGVKISSIAGNNYWQVRAASANQILTNGIKEYVGGVQVPYANLSSVVSFKVSLTSSQSVGNLTLGVYRPVPSNARIYDTSNASFGGSVNTVNFPIPNWNTTGIELGYYRVQARWNSSNAAGFREMLFLVNDTLPPNTTITYTPAHFPNFVNQTTAFTLTAVDNPGGSGVDYTQFNYTGSSAWQNYTLPFSLTSATNGTIRINYRSVDNAGNVEKFGTKIVRLDTIAPTTTISYKAAYAPNFVNMTTTFNLTAVDNTGGSGVAYTHYNYTGHGGLLNYSSPFMLSSATNGTITIKYFSTDHVGNVETLHTIVVKLDTIAPITTISYTPAYAPNFVTMVTTFNLSKVDNTGGSGIASTQYQYTGSGGYHAYTVPFTLSSATNGTITINYRSTDNVGNVEIASTLVVRLDTIAPITTITNNGTAVNASFYNISIKTTRFTIGASDTGGAGVASTNVTITGPLPALTRQSWIYLPGNTTFNFLGRSIMNAGKYNVSWYSTDHVGNLETKHWYIANLTRTTSITLISLSQSAYGYSSTNGTVYYGKNATARLSFIDDLGQSINSATSLNITVNGQHYTAFTSVGPGLYDILMNISSFNAANYGMTIIAKKTGLNNVTIHATLSVLPVPIKITILSRLQGTTELQPDNTGVYVGNSLKNLTILVAVNNSLDSTPMPLGTLNLLYLSGTSVLFNTTVADVNGICTIVLPISVTGQLTETDLYFKLQWIAPSSNYNATTASTVFTVRFSSPLANIDWFSVAIVLIMILLVAVLYNVVLRKVVIPRKLERHNFLAKISSAFEDAANIQNVLVIHKASGTCLFFKAYGKSSLDPDLITGFLTAIQSFGAEMSGNKSLEELTWQDYQLVLGEGALIRVALVLASKASGILKGLVPQFVAKYEASYKDKLANWRGDLTSFRDSVKVINDVFDTAIILPHKRSDMPVTPRSSLAKKIMEVAGTLTKDRDYFFIATLLSESIERTKQNYSEIIAAIQELRKDNILIPIDIESIEKKKEITQQEVVNLQQRVAQIPFLNPDEKAKLIQDLVKMPAEEREATLGSMTVMSQLQSATSQSIRAGEPGGVQSKQAGTITSQVPANIAGIKNKNEAMSRIKNIDKSAKICLKNYEYEGAIKLYEESEAIAAQWNLKSMITEITHKKIDASARDIEYKQTVVLSDARNAEKQGDNATAIQKYTEAANYSSSLFKLGISTEDKKMREYVKKAEALKKQRAA